MRLIEVETSDDQTSDIRLSHCCDWLFASHGDRDIRRSDVRYQTVTALWLVFVLHRDGAVAAAGRIYKNVASFAWHSQSPRVTAFLRLLFVCTSDTARRRAKRCLRFICSMFVNRREHKGPRLVARPRSMAAFYKFKAAISAFH